MDNQEKYENLLYKYNQLEKKYRELEEKYNDVYDKLSSANFKIRTELEPRIAREKRAYDNYITNPERGR